jgi:hypothetical protein
MKPRPWVIDPSSRKQWRLCSIIELKAARPGSNSANWEDDPIRAIELIDDNGQRCERV